MAAVVSFCPEVLNGLMFEPWGKNGENSGNWELVVQLFAVLVCHIVVFVSVRLGEIRIVSCIC